MYFVVVFNYSMAFLFSLIECQSAAQIHTAQIPPVRISGISVSVPKNIIAASAKIARNAPCSR